MERLSGFFTDILSTFWGPELYVRVHKESVVSAFIFYSAVVFLYCAAFSIVFLWWILPYISTTTINKAVELYPQDLVVTIQDGHASINQPEPYRIINPFDDGKENLVVIDTKSEFTGKELDSESTYAFVSRNFMVIEDSNNKTNMLTFDTFATTTEISKKTIEEVVAQIPPAVPGVLKVVSVVLAFFLTFAVASVMVGYYALYMFVPALAVFAVVRLTGEIIEFRDAYIASLYASVPAILISGLMFLLAIPRPVYAFTLVVLLVAFVNLKGHQRPAQSSTDMLR